MLAAYHWSWGPRTGSGDYAQYLSHALALAEGRPYTDIGYIYHPSAAMVGPRAYPPGLPLTLAPIVAFAGVNSPLIRVALLGSVLAFAYFAYRRLALDIAPWQAAIAGAFSAFVVEARYGTIAPLSDAGLCALMWATILTVDSATSWTWRRIALVTALGFAAMAYRVAGVALVPALGLYALFSWQRHHGRAMIPVAIWGVSGAAVLMSPSIDLPFAERLLPSFRNLYDRLLHALQVYPYASLDAVLYPFPWNFANDAHHVIASIAMICGVAALLWRLRRTMFALTTVMYAALLLASPAINGRYLWPLFPVLTAGFVVGVTAACRAVANRIGWARGPAIAAGVLAILALGALSTEIKRPEPDSHVREPETRALFAWLRARSERETIRVAYFNPRVLTLETRVPAIPHLFATPSEHVASLYELGITHLVWPLDTPRECRARLARDLPGVFPDRFSLEYENAGYRLYRLVGRDRPVPRIIDYRPSWARPACDPSRRDRDSADALGEPASSGTRTRSE